ncbi:MAG: RNA-binding cell elongation regulator Jag/EloR [Desulfobacterales bacterium]
MALTMELEAKNVEQAVKLACDKLEIPPEKLKYDVISYGSTGIFGFVKNKKAKIRVLLTEEKAETRKTDETRTGEGGQTKPAEIKNRVKGLIEQAFNGGEPEAVPETEKHIAAGKQVLQRIVDTISSGAVVTVEKNAERVLYNVTGGNSGILIGKHGQTIDAMQALVEKIVNKKNTARLRVQVDMEGYLESRKKNLIRHAESLANKCKHIRRPVTVGRMNAHDRRIVHLALKDDSSVRTRSTGDGFLRKLVIHPNNTSTRRRPS